MTTPDLATLREALEELSDRPGANWEEVDPSTATVIAAGLWALDLIEGGKEVWWCLEHDASFQREPEPTPPTWGCWGSDLESVVNDCNMVKRLLVAP